MLSEVFGEGAAYEVRHCDVDAAFGLHPAGELVESLDGVMLDATREHSVVG
jgi:hypothetical protein